MKKSKYYKIVSITLAAGMAFCAVPAYAGENDLAGTFASQMEEKFSTDSLSMENRPQVRWWLDEGYHTDETLKEAVNNLYEQGYGGVELLCLNDSSLDNSIYGWGTEEWKHDLLVIVEECGKLGMSVSFAAGPDWQPTFLYYGTNEDVKGNSSWQDYYEDYALLREQGKNVLEAAKESGGTNVYENEEEKLTIDPNVDVFNQGIINGEGVYVKPGETVSIDVTSFTYEAPEQTGGPGGPGGPEGVPGAPGDGGDAAEAEDGVAAGEEAPGAEETPEGEAVPGAEETPDGNGTPEEGMPEGEGAPEESAAPEEETSEGEEAPEEDAAPAEEGSDEVAMIADETDQATLMGTNVSRTKYNVNFDSIAGVSVAKVEAKDASYHRTTINTYFTNEEDVTGTVLSVDGVEQFSEEDLSVGGLVSYDEATGKYTLTWTNPYDFETVLVPEWAIGVGSGTAADTYDYGYMLMVNHFSTAGADAWYAFLKSYILTDDMMELINKYNIRWDLFIDSLEISSLGRFYWSNELTEVFKELKGYDVTPYLPALYSTDYTFDGIDKVENDMRDALTEAYIRFQERLSEDLKESGGELRAQVSYGTTLTTSSAIRAVDVPETESLAFKFSVEAYKLMSGGVHLSGANEFSSETNNWLGVDNASYNDQLYNVHQQMAAGVNRVVWHGYETEYSSEAVSDWPTNSGGIGCEFGTVNIPTSVLESDFSEHITRLQQILKTGTETVDVGVMQNDLFIIALNQDGDSKGLLTSDHTLQDKGYSWECFDSSYLWAEDGAYGKQNEDGTLGNPQYKAVIVWDEDLSLAAAKALKNLVDNGLYVIFNTDAAATTTGSENESDEELSEIISQIKADTAHVATAASTEEFATLLEGFGVTPRVALEKGVCEDYNQRIYEESTGVGESYYSYDGIWSSMMRDEDANYYYFFNESVDYPMETKVTFEGEFTPYVINTWSGEVSPVTDYTCADGKTELTLSLEPQETIVYIMDKNAENSADVENTDAPAEEGQTEDGAQDTQAEDSASGDITWDENWHVSIEQWSKGDVLTRTETRDNVDPYTGETFEYEGSTQHETTEYGYATNKEVVFDQDVANADLVSWKDMYAAGVSDKDLTAVCGVGTYTTTFTASEDGQNVQLDLGKIDGMIGLTVNDQKFHLDIDHCTTDISDAVVAGENEVVVTVCSNLTNTLLEGEEKVVRGMQEAAPYYPIVYKDVPESYGLQAPASITAGETGF